MTKYTAENNLVIIPARSGSQRVAHKNIRLLAGKPLIVWSIEMALNEVMLGDVVVSTDSKEYAAIAKAAGALVPELRSSENSEHASRSADAILEALNQYESHASKKVEWITLLQPTSPFRSVNTLQQAISSFMANEGDTVVSVSPMRIPRSWQITINPNNTVNETLPYESEEPIYHYNGSIYIFSANTLRETNDLYSENIRPVIVESTVEGLDIDTEEDWTTAELFARSYS